MVGTCKFPSWVSDTACLFDRTVFSQSSKLGADAVPVDLTIVCGSHVGAEFYWRRTVGKMLSQQRRESSA